MSWIYVKGIKIMYDQVRLVLVGPSAKKCWEVDVLVEVEVVGKWGPY